MALTDCPSREDIITSSLVQATKVNVHEMDLDEFVLNHAQQKYVDITITCC